MSIKTKRIILYSLYGAICITFIVSLFLVKSFLKEDPNVPILNVDIKPVDKIVDDNTTTVFGEVDKLSRPYLESNMEIGVNFYDSFQNKENQENSIIYYENTYMPSTGIFYKSDKVFDVISIYNGKVEEITKNDLLGNIIKINYNNNFTTTYQCIDNIKVNVGDDVKTGTILATSSTCNVFKDKGNGLYLELIYNGKNINPEYYYGKTIEEL